MDKAAVILSFTNVRALSMAPFLLDMIGKVSNPVLGRALKDTSDHHAQLNREITHLTIIFFYHQELSKAHIYVKTLQ